MGVYVFVYGGNNGGLAWFSLEKSQLSEIVSDFVGEDLNGRLIKMDLLHDLAGACLNEEELVSRVALLEDDVSWLEDHVPETVRDLTLFVDVHGREQGDALEEEVELDSPFEGGLLDDEVEGLPVEQQQGDGVFGEDRVGTRRVVEQVQLSEALAPVEGAQDLTLLGVRELARTLHRALVDDVHRVPVLVLAVDVLALLERPTLDRVHYSLQVVEVQRPEQKLVFNALFYPLLQLLTLLHLPHLKVSFHIVLSEHFRTY